MPTRTTIYDVARHAGVSKSLVSLVLRGSPKVSDAKREAVRQAIDALGYQPNRLAAGLAGTRTASIGVVIDDFRNLWFVEMLQGLQEAVGPHGYSLSVADMALNAHIGVDAVTAFRSMQVDGLVVAAETTQLLNAVGETPVVVAGAHDLGADAAGGGVPVVATDDEAGGRIATEHLLDLGHRRITFVSGPGEAARLRSRGYAQAMGEAGVDGDVVPARSTSEDAAREALTTRLRRRSPAPTAVIAANDPMAIGVLGVLRAAGMAVPGDVSVVGYDDSTPASYDLISLTSMDDRGRDVGREAGRMLLAAIRGEQSAAPRLTRPALVPRSTSGPAPLR